MRDLLNLHLSCTLTPCMHYPRSIMRGASMSCLLESLRLQHVLSIKHVVLMFCCAHTCFLEQVRVLEQSVHEIYSKVSITYSLISHHFTRAADGMDSLEKASFLYSAQMCCRNSFSRSVLARVRENELQLMYFERPWCISIPLSECMCTIGFTRRALLCAAVDALSPSHDHYRRSCSQ